MILALDPGSHVVGWAALHGPIGCTAENVEVIACGLLRPKTLLQARLQAADLRDYVHRLGVRIALVGGIVVGVFDSVEIRSVKPAVWKKQVPKEIMLQRIKKHLNPREQALVEAVKPASLLHNVIDSTGLGLWAVGRLPRG